MGQKYQVICLAITDKKGNMHRNQIITKDEHNKVQIKDVILDADMFEVEQLKSYLADGSVKPVEIDDEEEVSSATPEDELETLKAEYLALSGRSSVPGTWGKKKLTGEIEALKDDPDD